MRIRTDANDKGWAMEGAAMPSMLRENLIRLRNERGLTQTQLAKRARVPQSTISRLESGALATGRWGTLEAIAKVLGVDASVLASDEPASLEQHDSGREPVETEDAVGRTRAADLLQLYLASDWPEQDKPNPEELRWLANLGWITWTGKPPTARTVHVLLGQRRAGVL